MLIHSKRSFINELQETMRDNVAGFVDRPDRTSVILRDVPFSEYRQLPGVNASTISKLAEGYRAYQSSVLENSPESIFYKESSERHFAKGTATHSLVLEGSAAYNRDVVIMPTTRIEEGEEKKNIRRGKWWDGFKAENHGKVILSGKERFQVDAMAQAVFSHQGALEEFDKAPQRELTILWWSNQFQTVCKARLDAVSLDGRSLVDLKTTRDVDLDAFSRACGRYGYHIQAYWYTEAAINGFDISEEQLAKSPIEFSFVVVESSKPAPEVAVFSVPSEMMLDGYYSVEAAFCAYEDKTWKYRSKEVLPWV